MKKIYEKPFLYAETFELTEHVAGDCGPQPSQITVTYGRGTETCKYQDGNLVLQLDNIVCHNDLYIEAIDGDFANYMARLLSGGYDCYNAFTTGLGAFSS